MYTRATPNEIRTVPIESPTNLLSSRPTKMNTQNPPSIITVAGRIITYPYYIN